MLEHLGTCWNILERVGTCWNVLVEENMSDFDFLKHLQAELIKTLERRTDCINNPVEWQGCYGIDITQDASIAKIKRLRLMINEVMLRIEQSCRGIPSVSEKESWMKGSGNK